MSDAVAALVWLVASAFLITAALRWTRVVFTSDSAPARIVHVIVFCWACIVGSALLLELFGSLAPHNLLLTTTAVSGAVLCWSSASGKAPPRRIARGRVRLRWAVWAFMGSVVAGRSLLEAATGFPTDWDSLAYHIPLIDHWVRDGTLYAPACAFWYCPGNFELLGYWFVAPFSGDYWIALNNLAVVTLLATSVLELLAALKVIEIVRHLAAVVVVATTIVWRQLVSNENDVAVAALLMACLWYAFRVSRHRKRGDLLLCAACFGLLAGTKYLALGYAGVAGFAVVALLLLDRRATDVGKACAYGAAGALLFASYWYLRNYLVSGTPLFPKGVLGGPDLWEQMRPESATSSLVYSGRPIVAPLLYEAVLSECGWFHVAAVLLLPAAVISVTLLTSSGLVGRRYAATRIWILAVALLASLVFLWTPNVVETAPGSLNMLRSKYHSVRLGFAALSILPVLSAVVTSDLVRMSTCPRALSSRARTCTRAWRQLRCLTWVGRGCAMVASALVAAQVWPYASAALATGTIAIAVCLGAIYCLSARLLRCTWAAVAGAGFVLGGFAWGSHVRAQIWHNGFTKHYVEQLRSDILNKVDTPYAAAGVICVCDYRYYPFIGSRRQNDVRRPLWIPAEEDLLEYVCVHRATVVVYRKLNPSGQARYVGVAEAISTYPDVFIPIAEDLVYIWATVDRERLQQLRKGKGRP